MEQGAERTSPWCHRLEPPEARRVSFRLESRPLLDVSEHERLNTNRRCLIGQQSVLKEWAARETYKGRARVVDKGWDRSSASLDAKVGCGP